jgi:hypothetical protein
MTVPQGWLLHVEHVTRFAYSQSAHASYNEAPADSADYRHPDEP